MPNFVQILLSPRPPRTVTAQDNPFLSDNGAVECEFKVEDGVSVVYARHKMSMAACQGDQSAPCAPPKHIHLDQSEHFTVVEGQMGAIMGSESLVLKAGDPEYTSPALTPHTFWPVEAAGDLVLKVRCTPTNNDGFDEAFFRNFQSYLNDCRTHKMDPSIPQLVLFLWSAGIVLAMPFPLAITKAISWFIGPFIGGLLGYQSQYSEYYEEKKTK